MRDRSQPGGGARAPLTRERVLRTAIDIADRDGLGAVTMRGLAQRLGVEAMSLYHHVRSKDALLEGMAQLVLAEMEVAAPGGAWKAALRRSALSAHEVLERHGWAPGVVASVGPVPERLRFMEGLLSTMRAAGFSPALTDHGYHALDSHITGFTLWLASLRIDEVELESSARQLLAQLPVDEFPGLIEHLQQHLQPRDAADEGSFAFGLDLILDGLERLLIKGPRSHRDVPPRGARGRVDPGTTSQR